MNRPDLIVPIHDRRRHKRYLTLKNVAIACAAVLAVFVCVSIYFEVRRPAPNDYGRLATRRVSPSPAVNRNAVEVVPESRPIDDQSSADPTLLQPMMRAQTFGVDTASLGDAQRPPAPVSVRTGKDVAVVGGPEGLTVVKKKRQGPDLSGGFGRPVSP